MKERADAISNLRRRLVEAADRGPVMASAERAAQARGSIVVRAGLANALRAVSGVSGVRKVRTRLIVEPGDDGGRLVEIAAVQNGEELDGALAVLTEELVRDETLECTCEVETRCMFVSPTKPSRSRQVESIVARV